MQHASVIIPACNEEHSLGNCLGSLSAQDVRGDFEIEIIVVANGCTDGTAAIAESFGSGFAERGWRFRVVDTPEPGKTKAINTAEREARPGGARVFLDADTVLGPGALEGVLRAVADGDAAFATGRLNLVRANSLISRLYGRMLMKVPYFAEGDAGSGFFAVSPAGRARWSELPDIISDDTFMRSHFSKSERVTIDAPYWWSVVEGWRALLRVRRRNEIGGRQLRKIRPEAARERKSPAARLAMCARLALQQPIAFVVFSLIVVTAKLTADPSDLRWARGR